MIDLQWINPINLHDHWDTIKEGLEKLSRIGDNWLPEDVYSEIKTGTSFLHIGYQDNEYKGFLVTQHIQSRSGIELNIWVCYSYGRSEDKLLESAMPTVEQWARNINAKRITFYSPRKGWLRKDFGFKPQTTKFSKEVDYGLT